MVAVVNAKKYINLKQNNNTILGRKTDSKLISSVFDMLTTGQLNGDVIENCEQLTADIITYSANIGQEVAHKSSEYYSKMVTIYLNKIHFNTK